MAPQNSPRPTKAERTAQAREQARLIREAQQKKEKRNGWLLRGGVLVAAVVIVVVVALFIVQAQKGNEPVASSGPVPANANVNGGIVLGKNNAVLPPTTTAGSVDAATVPPAPAKQPTAATGLESIGIKASAAGKPVQIVAYVDFLCPACKNFEQQYGAQLQQWQDSGKATVEYRPTGLLDGFSSTNYSSRAAAAAACVVAATPEKFKAYFDALYAQQPPENGAGLDNATLKKIATEVGAGDIGSCVDAKTYRPFVAHTTKSAIAHGVSGTPTVFVNGQQYPGQGDFAAFATGIMNAKK